MRRNAVAVFVLLALASGACKKTGDQPATDAAAGLDTTTAAAPETGAAAPAPQEAAPASEPSRPRIETAPPPPVTTAVVQDVPYHSTDTGTVAPGMSEADVVAMWGKPVARSSTGAMTYLYFPNGCERSCGTMDVVFLENDRVVDAILRWPGHGYSGESSSPPGTTPAATRPTQ